MGQKLSSYSNSLSLSKTSKVTTTSRSHPDPDVIYAYHPTYTTYNIGEVNEIVLHDETRQKDVPVHVYYPKLSKKNAPPQSVTDEKYPVVIFSHGWLASKDNYESVGRNFARHGYVCIHPTHADSILYTLKQEGVRPALSSLGHGVNNLVTEYRAKLGTHLLEPTHWKNRAKDIHFVLDSIPTIVKEIPALSGKVDSERVGVMGHSMGAYAASLMAGTEIYINDTDQQGEQHVAGTRFRDARVKAVVCVSPQGSGVLGLQHNSWRKIECPMMILAGGRDTIWGYSPTWTHEVFDVEYSNDPNVQQNPQHPKMLVFIKDAAHGFGGLFSNTYAKILGYEVNKKHVQYVKMSSLAFFDAYVKNNASALTYLMGDSLGKYAVDDILVRKKLMTSPPT
jgi:predicted dienelactone hydrolase